MSTSSSVRRAVRYALLASAAVAVVPTVHAQQPDTTIQEVVVTGTRIARPDYTAASPIVSVGEEAFRQTGSTTVETLLNTLPQFVPSLTSTSNNPGNNGQANVELRGLSPTRTLVLLDGKRIVPADGTGIVDVNMIPAALIQNVEIISGGASAVYGSDAVAGVVNFRLKEFDGVEFESNWGETAESDGEEWTSTLSAGTKFADDRGRVMASVSYSDRSAVLADRRDFSRITQGWFGEDVGFLPLGSPTIEEGRVTVAAPQAAIDALFQTYGFAPGSVRNNTFAFNADGTLFATGDGDTPGSVVNFRGERGPTFNDADYTYNFSPTNYLQLPLERTTAFARGSFELSPSAEVYLQGIWAEYDAAVQLAPTPASQMFVPVTNPFVPADLRALALQRADPNQPLSLTKRLTELGPRFENNEYQVYQVLGGVRGDISEGGWSYDVYASYGDVHIDNPQLGSISRTRFEELTFAADGGASICGGFNPFGVGSISQECAEYVRVDAVNTYDVKQTIAEASVSGPLLQLPAGQWTAAFGAFYKKDEFAFIADDKLRGDTTGAFGLPIRVDVAGFNASDNTLGETDSTEFYVETAIPLLADKPGVERLEATVGYRFADYSSAGGVNSYKAELTYEPAGAMLVRGSYQRAVRAPNISELFQPQVTNFPALPGRDPCRITSDERTGPNAEQVRALCIAQGLPTTLVDAYNNGATQVEGISGGNPELSEETADTLTFGVVLRSQSDNPWLSSLQASVDWYSIEIDDAISVVNASIFVPRCYDPAYNPTFSVDNEFCSRFSRSSFNGEITGAAELQENIGGFRTSGIDVQVDWAADVGPGRVGVNWIASWLQKFDQQDLPGDPFLERGGTIGSQVATAFPDWKWTFSLSYDIANLDLTARWRYIDDTVDLDESTFQLPSVSYLDFTASYTFESMIPGLRLRGGVTNLTDKDPPNYPGAIQSNTDPSTYDVLGRRYFVSAIYKF
jgi:iron complex outermembrane recepter protein